MATNTLQRDANSQNFSSDGDQVQTQLTDTSKKIIDGIDTDGDGVISYSEAANYAKKQEKDVRQWKCYFIGLLILLFIIFGAIFGLFILGFELTKNNKC